MHFGGRTGCVERIFVKLEMTRALPGSSLVYSIKKLGTLWCRLEDMFQLLVTPQGIEKVTIQLVDTPKKVYAVGARLFLSKVFLAFNHNLHQ